MKHDFYDLKRLIESEKEKCQNEIYIYLVEAYHRGDIDCEEYSILYDLLKIKAFKTC